MNRKSILCVVLAAGLATPPRGFAASHREAPITALDHKADITDFYAFVSYDDPSKVTFLLNVDPLLEPGNGPTYFPFDDTIQYAIRIDNNNDAQEDVYFLFQFQTEVRAPNVFTAFVGAGAGINAPANDAEAERDAQWILDLRPGSRLGFVKAAAVRERFGDREGAIEFLDEAARRTSPNDSGERAWLEKQKRLSGWLDRATTGRADQGLRKACAGLFAEAEGVGGLYLFGSGLETGERDSRKG